jgi:hypothetical protein
MKVTARGSARAMVYELVVLVDMGFSEEGGEIQMFFNHPL